MRSSLFYARIALCTAVSLCLPVGSASAQQIAHWTFDEGQGSMAADRYDMSPGLLFGFATNAWQPGPRGLALSFDGISSYVEHDLALPSEEGTLAHWAMPVDQELRISMYEGDYPDGTGGYNGFGSSGDQLENHVGSGDLWRFYYQDGSGPNSGDAGGRWKVEGGTVEVGVWTHVTATWDRAGDLVLYVDCVEVDRKSLVDATFDDRTVRQSYIGRPVAAERFWKGLIDDVRVFEQALSPSDVRETFCREENPVSTTSVDNQAGSATERFGSHVALGGGVLVATDVRSGISGEVWFFDGTSDGSWIERDSFALPWDSFPYRSISSVATDGTTAVVGGAGLRSPYEPGAAAIYERQGTDWQLVAELHAPAGWDAPSFARSVAVHGDWIAVAAPGDPPDSGFPGVAGAVHVYQRDPATGWDYVYSVEESIPSIHDRFGSAIDLFDGILAVAEARADGSSWVLVYHVPNTSSFVLEIDYAQVSALAIDRSGARELCRYAQWWCRVMAVGVPTVAGGDHPGRVIVVEVLESWPFNSPARGSYEWAVIEPIDLDPTDRFGHDVAMYGDYLIASSSPIVSASGSPDRGATYVYRRSPSSDQSSYQLLHQALPAVWASEDEGFGAAIAVDDRRLVVGSPELALGNGSHGTVSTFMLPVFIDGFEEGDLTSWSSTTP